MNRFPLSKVVLTLALALFTMPSGKACTNIIVGKAASADGSVICTYNCDTFGYSGWLTHSPAGRHAAGEKIPIRSFWHPAEIKGYVDQVEYTYNVIGYINEKQLCIVETTFGGRPELVNPEGILAYDNVIQLALQRCSSAREAIRTMGELMDNYGYNDKGETFTVCDKDEAWIMEIVGKGPGRKGAVWVAVRIPDDCVSAHANISRIRQFPQVAKVRKNSLYQEVEGQSIYSSDVVSFAREMGFFSGKDADFSFRDAYCPISFLGVRQCDARVWSFFRHHTDPAEMDKYLPYINGDMSYNTLYAFFEPVGTTAQSPWVRVALSKIDYHGWHYATARTDSLEAGVAYRLSGLQLVKNDSKMGYSGTIKIDNLLKLPSTAVNSITAGKSLVKVGPVPASDYIVASADGFIDGVELVNAAGQLVARNAANFVNVSNVAPGVYFLRVYMAGRATTHKVIVKH